MSGRSFTSIQSCRCQPSSFITGASARRLERHAAAVMQLSIAEEMVEPQSAHAERRPATQLRHRHGLVGDRHRAQPVRLMGERVQHGGIVAAVRAALHQDAAREAEGIEHARYFAAAHPAACSCGRPHRESALPARTRGRGCRTPAAAAGFSACSARAARGRPGSCLRQRHRLQVHAVIDHDGHVR